MLLESIPKGPIPKNPGWVPLAFLLLPTKIVVYHANFRDFWGYHPVYYRFHRATRNRYGYHDDNHHDNHHYHQSWWILGILCSGPRPWNRNLLPMGLAAISLFETSSGFKKPGFFECTNLRLEKNPEISGSKYFQVISKKTGPNRNTMQTYPLFFYIQWKGQNCH